MKPRLIAFYLPQYYPTPENDEWWGKGFTEWTNVGRAKPLFRGHYQPRVPADLGYYDLRVPEVREEQASLAREAGIEGFCYWHYWFAGRRLLDRVFEEVVTTGKPDYPFCLCWANHSWYKKTWDPTMPDKLLIEQTYPGEQDFIAHFNAMLPAFKDKRYMKVNGKLIFGIFDPLKFADFGLFKRIWNDLAKKEGLEGFYFFGYNILPDKNDEILSRGYDSVVLDGINRAFRDLPIWRKKYESIKNHFFKIPSTISYTYYVSHFLNLYHCTKQLHPSIDPNFDHSPRSTYKGAVIVDSTPSKWKRFCREVFLRCKNRNHEENLVFIKAWNEWGEGNYLEPDMKFGKDYIKSLSLALKDFDK